MQRLLTALVLVLAMIAPLPVSTQAQRKSSQSKTGAATSTSAAGRRAAEQITATQLKDYLSFVASDEMEGRDTPSRGLDTTAKFIALNLSRWGFKPGGDDGTFFQKIALRRFKINQSGTRAEMGGQSFSYGSDFLASTSGGVSAPSGGSASGALVYVGNGWVIKAKDIDAYKGVDVKDKIMIVAGGNLPKGVTFSDIQNGKAGVDFDSPITYAQSHGAKGLIFVPNANSLTNWERSRELAVTRGSQPVVERFQQTTSAAALPIITVSLGMLDAIFRGETVNGAEIFRRRIVDEPGAAFALSPSKTMSFTVSTIKESVGTQNVIGIWEGSDPLLKNEYVAVGAHYDHVGVGTPVNGDAIYNGADDDGSGTVAVLSMAEAFAHSPRPKRSIIFVWHCGEEKGLWGSRYFTENPTVPINQIVTQLNIDMIGRSRREGDTNKRNESLSGPNEIYVIGSRMMSTELGALSDRVNQSYLNISYNFKYDDPNDPNRFFFRSDHYNYARKGVPIIFYFDGEHEDYHRPGDEVSKIDFQKMEKVTRTIFLTGWEIANLAARPKVDKQLPTELNQ
ncbi:MAG: M20/M25/M40 family metallo-hydrolase [Pyrinomonadaceae bacterium]|nr:M20/M25/M40 family metallo-hydrolase [Pyrinomonadaceae bacterium]